MNIDWLIRHYFRIASHWFSRFLHTRHEASAKKTKSIESFDLLDRFYWKITSIYLYLPNTRDIRRILFIRSDKRQVKNEIFEKDKW